MMLNSVNTKNKNNNKLNISRVYSAKSKIDIRIASIGIGLIVLIAAVMLITNINPPSASAKDKPSTKAKLVNETAKDEQTSKKIQEDKTETNSDKTSKDETCAESAIKFGGTKSQTCTSDTYTKTYECFDNSELFDATILKYKLEDLTYINDLIVFREGALTIDGIDNYRILAAFKTTQCIVDIKTNTINKEFANEAFQNERDKITQ